MSLVNEVLRDLDERQNREAESHTARTRGEVHLTKADRQTSWLGWLAGGCLGAMVAAFAMWLLLPIQQLPSGEIVGIPTGSTSGFQKQGEVNKAVNSSALQTKITNTENKPSLLPSVISETSKTSESTSVKAVELETSSSDKVLNQSFLKQPSIDQQPQDLANQTHQQKDLMLSTELKLPAITLSVAEMSHSLSLHLKQVEIPPEVNQQDLQLVIRLPNSRWESKQTSLSMKYWPNITLISSATDEALLIIPMEKGQTSVQVKRQSDNHWLVALNKQQDNVEVILNNTTAINKPVKVKDSINSEFELNESASEDASISKLNLSNSNQEKRLSVTKREKPLSVRDQLVTDRAKKNLLVGQVDIAIAQLQDFLDKEPKAVLSSALLLDVYLSSGFKLEALSWLEEDVALSDSHKAYYRARLMAEDKRWLHAFELMDTHKPEMESFQEYYSFKAGIAQQAQQYEQAAVLYKQLLSFESKGSYWLGLGVCLDALQDSKGALNAFIQAKRHGGFSNGVMAYIDERIQANQI